MKPHLTQLKPPRISRRRVTSPEGLLSHDTMSSTDCRSEEGITVGLIDSLMSIARVLRPRCEEMLAKPYGADGNFHGPILHALTDLAQDGDMLALIGMAGRMQKWGLDWWSIHGQLPSGKSQAEASPVPQPTVASEKPATGAPAPASPVKSPSSH